MPTLLVRSKLVELLGLLPMDAHMDSLKEVLLRSGLGRIVNFHATHVGDGTDRERPGRGGRGRAVLPCGWAAGRRRRAVKSSCAQPFARRPTLALLFG
jgi:hypothetical protein